jgi:hypothetical protein
VSPILKHLDGPLTVVGVPITTIALIAGSFLFGAIFESFLLCLGALVLLQVLKKIFKKFPRFSLMRWVYVQLPTKSVLWGKTLESIVESWKSEWCK